MEAAQPPLAEAASEPSAGPCAARTERASTLFRHEAWVAQSMLDETPTPLFGDGSGARERPPRRRDPLPRKDLADQMEQL